jgi:FlaA1/EpsC-like NDP-sugar epimerase
MTIAEAVQLVIQAGAMAHGGEVFVLDMGEPVKISDLAIKMIRLSGRSVRDVDDPHAEIAIKLIGLRPGEKLYEELLISGDAIETDHPRIWKARENSADAVKFEEELQWLEVALQTSSATIDVRGILMRWVTGYAGPGHA